MPGPEEQVFFGQQVMGAVRAGAQRMGAAGGAFKTYFQSPIHQTGKKWIKETYGIGGAGGWTKWLGRGFLAYSAIQGYREGGLKGAVKNAATDAAWTYGMGAGLKALGMGFRKVGMAGWMLGGAAGGTAGIMAGLHLAGGGRIQDFMAPVLHEYMAKHTKLEMGAPVLDQFGTVSTMRQRSLMAIQNSKINGRTALGNEAALLFKPFYF